MKVLMQLLAEQAQTRSVIMLDLREHTEWLHGLTAYQMWGMFLTWGNYNATFEGLEVVSQRHQIEGWLIDHLFYGSTNDWWLIRQFLNDTSEYLDIPALDTSTEEIMALTDFQRAQVLPAITDLASNIITELRSTDLSNSRLRELYLCILSCWSDWWAMTGKHLESCTEFSSLNEASVIVDKVLEDAANDAQEDNDEEIE